MRKGIGVELPVANNAIRIPKADELDAVVVVVTQDGKLYLGTTQASSSEIGEGVRRALAAHWDKTVYVKADARIPYGTLASLLDSLQTTGAEGITFLTAQPGSHATGTLAAPEGLQMRVVAPK